MRPSRSFILGLGPGLPAVVAGFLLAVGGGKPALHGADETTLRPTPRRDERLWKNSLGMHFVPVPRGEFTMGSPPTEPDRAPNEVQRRVKLTREFLLSQTLVTVAEFAAFVRATDYRTAAEKAGFSYGAWNLKENKWDKLDGASWRRPGFEQSNDHPVVQVDWEDTKAFCAWLSEHEHRLYRLPTEAEWEYACRAGSSTAFPWSNRPEDGAGWANGADASAKDRFNLFPPFPWNDSYLFTSPVATFKPNGWGLYDMIGNVLEWCQDWYGEFPANATATSMVIDPPGPPTGKERVLRGGAFVYGPARSRSAFRGRNVPDFRNFYVGFRVVLESQSQVEAP